MQHFNVALLLGILTFSAAAQATPQGCPESVSVEGSFIVRKGKGFLPSTLSITETKNNEVLQFSLESYWSPKANDDGSSTTQGVFAGQIEVRSCVGHYAAPEGNCFLVFNFESAKVKVTSFGLCPHGMNAYPDGTYVKQSGRKNRL